MADGAVYDIYASQDAFELKPNLDNTIALDLQSQQVPGGAQNCTAVTTPVQTPGRRAIQCARRIACAGCAEGRDGCSACDAARSGCRAANGASDTGADAC